MGKYDARIKGMEKHIPHEPFDFEIWLENEDGTWTGPGGRILTEEELNQESELVMEMEDGQGNRGTLARWRADE